ncbi:hypothetical protein ACB092_03G001300 [Castanea dentata]
MYPNNENSNPAPYTSPPEGQWSTGLYDCFEDPSNCWLTGCCPIVTFGRIAEILKVQAHGVINFMYCSRTYLLLGSMYSWTCRAKLRSLYSLPPEPCGDCCVHQFCICCALCQEYRELKNRGLE